MLIISNFGAIPWKCCYSSVYLDRRIFSGPKISNFSYKRLKYGTECLNSCRRSFYFSSVESKPNLAHNWFLLSIRIPVHSQEYSNVNRISDFFQRLLPPRLKHQSRCIMGHYFEHPCLFFFIWDWSLLIATAISA